MTTSAVSDNPRFIYQFEVRRRLHLRRFFWSLLAAVGGLGAWAAFFYLAERRAETPSAGTLSPTLISVGQVIALGVAVLFFVRAIFALVRALRSRPQSAQFYDRGFRWQRGTETQQYAWSSVRNFREGYRQLKIGQMKLADWGGDTLEMKDGNTYTFTSRMGDPTIFARKVRPFISDTVGERMAQALREGKTIRLHPQLIVARSGVQARDEKIRWSEVDLKLRRGRLLVKRAEGAARTDKDFKTVATFPTRQINNLGPFLELASSTIKNHQPERYNIKTIKPQNRMYRQRR
jgi:hypothetical protein